MFLDIVSQTVVYGFIAYAIYQRYRSATSVTPPSPLELWLASKPDSFLKKVGIFAVVIAAGSGYIVWQNNFDNRGVTKLIFFVFLLGLLLVFRPGEWLDEAYHYNRDRRGWERLKKISVAELKQNYLKIVLQRLLVIGFILYLLIRFFP